MARPRLARPPFAGPRRRGLVRGGLVTVALAAGGSALLAPGPGVPVADAATRCSTPAPKARGAGSAAAAVRRIARRTGTDVRKAPRMTSPTSRPPSRLVREDVVDCRGTGARLGDTVEVRYRLVVWGRGTKTVDDSWARRPTSTAFGLQRGSLIEGWVKGIPGMTVGSRRLLVVPPSQAYGRQGTPDGSVPPNATLIFVVDLVRIRR